MAKLLTLSLTETTTSEYEVVAWDIDNNRWVLIPRLPFSASTIDNKPVWDLFQVTKANIVRDVRETRSNVHRIDMTTPPEPLEVVTGDERLAILQALSKNQSVNSPLFTDNYVTIVEPDSITDIIMTPKENVIDIKKPFYWESRVEFFLGGRNWEPARTKVGVACKDLRWKTFWHEIQHNRSSYFNTARDKWLRILTKNKTFLVIEYYNNHSNYVISGVHTLPV